MVGKTNVCGVKLFAVIAVTYPAGSTCGIAADLTNYSDAIYAKDTSGYWLFVVPHAGNWAVVSFTGDISNPDKIAYKVVGITTKGQVENVKMSYDLTLYDSGDEYSDITGGWSGFACYSGTSKGTFTKNSSSIYIKSNGSKGAQSIAAAPANKIDITDISTLKVNVTSFNVQSEYRSYLLLSSSRDTSSVSNAVASKEIKGTGETALDISGLSGSYYVIVYTRAVDGANTYELTFNRVYGT